MKKIVSLILILLMIGSMATVSMAAKEDIDGQYTAQITKNYTKTNGEEPAVIPAETLRFLVTADPENPDPSKLITIGNNNTYTVSGAQNTIAVNLPTYDKVGVYNYTVKEQAPETLTQGVTYSQTGTTNGFNVQVVAYYETENNQRVIKTDMAFTSADGSSKIDKFDNYYDLGNLSIQKVIDGNLASDTQMFTITVTFHAENQVLTDITVSGGSDSSNPTVVEKNWTGDKEVPLKLKANETITFTNIPKDVTYTIVEAAEHKAADANGSNPAAGYTVSGEVTQAKTIVIDTTTPEVIKNEKNTQIDTGIITDSAPYVLLIAVCLGAAVLFLTKRRSVEF